MPVCLFHVINICMFIVYVSFSFLKVTLKKAKKVKEKERGEVKQVN